MLSVNHSTPPSFVTVNTTQWFGRKTCKRASWKMLVISTMLGDKDGNTSKNNM